MQSRIFLAVVGGAYLVLAGWCAAMPGQTSTAVGFELHRGSGQSEFLTVYGGLQFALAVVFLWPLIHPSDSATVLRFCLWLHGCLVVFRSISFIVYSGIPTMTYLLASIEWLILLGSAGCFLLTRRNATVTDGL